MPRAYRIAQRRNSVLGNKAADQPGQPLRLLHLDCGIRDEWHLHLGARIFARRLRELGIAHQHEEFEDGHMNVGYRYDVSLPKLGVALGATRG